MDKVQTLKTLDDLKSKQAMIRKTWDNTGNRSLLNYFIEIIPILLHAERCSIFIHDPTIDRVWVQAGTGLTENELNIPAKTSLVGRTISRAATIVENDLANKIGAHDTVAIKTGYISYKAVCTPIIGMNKTVIGAIEVLNKKDNMSFDDNDCTLLEKTACQIEGNIDQLFQRQELFKISEEMLVQIGQLEKELKD